MARGASRVGKVTQAASPVGVDMAIKKNLPVRNMTGMIARPYISIK